jgi:hypothetical protein
MNKSILISLFFLLHFQLVGQTEYFFGNKKFNPNVPSPEAFLGYPIGSHHTRYDKIVEYMILLSKTSDRVKVQKIGETNEHRDQIIVSFAKPQNLANLENIRKVHLESIDINNSKPTDSNQPVIVWLGHNVHGNEPSGGESTLLSAYYLAASEEPETLKWLDNAVILMEPVINPDGRDRHSNWANMHKGNPLVADNLDREHNEVWPGGRTNHYWFDLNRDWYLAVNVESRNRLAFYHTWLPNVVTDFHEMGTNSTHFFEPSKLNAENPLVPKANYRDLNLRFAKYFENAMNEIGSFYYTKDSFDNFYPGYGSSYPDMQGGLGLLFEQASSRGHLQESQNGDLSFGFTVRNQLVNALATVRAAVDEKSFLQNYQKAYFTDVVNQAKKGQTKAYIIGDNFDKSRNKAFWEMLMQHKIDFYHLQNNQTIDNQIFVKGNAVIIPTDQPQYLLIRSMFDKPKTFADSSFYDASTWNLAYAYGLANAELKQAISLGEKVEKSDLLYKVNSIEKPAYAYLIDWRDYYAPKFLFELQKREIITKVAYKSFKINNKEYGKGTLLVQPNIQKMSQVDLLKVLNEISKAIGVETDTVPTGFSQEGMDLGANYMKTIEIPKALMIVGTGINASEAGEVWHALDTKIGMPITKVEIGNFNRVNLNKYNTLVMVSGNYDALIGTGAQKIKDWVSQGGNLITLKTASEWVCANKISTERTVSMKPDSVKNNNRVNFEDIQSLRAAKGTNGAIFEVDIDNTNPIGFGFPNRKIAIYRNNNTILERSKNLANSVMVYTPNPWLCGYVHAETLKKIANTSAINVDFKGAGRIIMFSDNPNFRGTWFGTNKLFFNALFFGGGMNMDVGGHEEE